LEQLKLQWTARFRRKDQVFVNLFIFSSISQSQARAGHVVKTTRALTF